MEKKIIFFDFETNGINPTDSVLSLSAMKVAYNIETNKMRELGKFNRFYFRNEGEEPNLKAIEVNGLTDERISKIREEQNATYPLNFKDDIMGFYEFCDGAEHFIAHNIRFDRQFLPFKLTYQFDTMLENVNILKIPNEYGRYKWPKLQQCAEFYRVPLIESQLHGSMYDVEIMARVLFRMTQNINTLSIIRRFIVDNISTRL